ncbi:hypothetical protein LXA43DRAFT_683630 [Ganoderma leucocontextum]|nr:hypothetical protein LXA43DRAFT_683630 [Ganoderma leucocontextum]
MDISTDDKERRRPDGDEPPPQDHDASGRQTTALGEVQRDQDVWLPDGSIIVITENIAFRVHKSVLSLHSEVFRDLFLVPTPRASNTADPMETLDDCPVVKLSDNLNDLRHLFLVLCYGKNYYYRDDEPQAVPFDVLESLIRMGHKYCVHSVLRDALFRLQKYYSTDMSTWLDHNKRAQYVAAPEPRSAIRTINVLAPLTNTPSLLPAAFLTCCGLIEPMMAEVANTSGLLGMNLADVLRVINGTAALTRAGVDRIVRLATAIPSKRRVCQTGNCLYVARRALYTREKDSSLHEMQNHAAAFEPTLHAWFWSAATTTLCTECEAESNRKDEERCRESWRQLPAMLGLEVDGWPDRTKLA